MVFLVALCLIGCALEPQRVPEFSIPIVGVSSAIEAVQWTAKNIQYVPDPVREYWSTPEETFYKKYGDCEDFALLAMYLIKKEAGGNPRMVIGMSGNYGHAWLVCDGIDYEPQMGIAYPGLRSMFPDHQEELSYDYAMECAYFKHSRRIK